MLNNSKVIIFSHYNNLKHTGHLGSKDSKGESPDRILEIMEELGRICFERNPLDPFSFFSFREGNAIKPASMESLWRCHSVKYISKLFKLVPYNSKKLVHFSPGNSGIKTRFVTDGSPSFLVMHLIDRQFPFKSFLSPGSLDAILYAAGSVIAAVDATLAEDHPSFCCIRPPGHHCGFEGVEALDTDMELAQGFCFVNNVMVGACHAVSLYGIRVGIIDFDVHHVRQKQCVISSKILD
jgi:acetoin utilization deacetylase AcuC-like enzyme